MENKTYNYILNEILSKVLQLSENPSQFTEYLTRQIRELVGARTIVIAVKEESGQSKIIHVFPIRKKDWANQISVLNLAELSFDFKSVQFLERESGEENIRKILQSLEMEHVIAIPLITANQLVGSILLLDIMDPFGIDSVITLLDRLSGVFALVIRNSNLYQNMENLVAIRTKELKKRNEELLEREQQLQNTNEEYEVINEELIESIRKTEIINEQLKQAKEKAEESEKRFNLAMNASKDGLFDWNLETNEIYYSPGWKKMLGYEEHELPNDFSVWENTTEPKDVKKSWKLQQKLISKQIDRFVMEFKMLHKNGHWVDILSRAEAIFNEAGKAVRIVGTHTDITELKQTEQLLQEKNEEIVAQNEELNQANLQLVEAKEKAEKTGERFNLAMKASADGIFDRNLETNEIYFSPGWKKMLGYEEHELPNDFSVWEKLTDPKDLDRVSEMREKLIKKQINRYAIEFKMKHKEGHWVDILSRAEAIFDESEKAVRMIGTHTDITEHKQAEQELVIARENAEKSMEEQRKLSEILAKERILLRTIVDSIPDAIYVKDLDYRKVMANKADCLNCGLEKEEDIIGKSDFDVFPVELAERLLDDDKKVIEEGIPVFNREERLENPNYNEKWLLTSKLPLSDATGKTIGLVGIGRDFTERRRSEVALRKSEDSLQAVLNSTADGILAVGKDNNVLYANERFSKLWRIPSDILESSDDSILLQYILDQLSDPEGFLKKVQELYSSDKESFDTICFKDDRVFERLSRPLLAESEVIGRVWSFRDITVRKQAEQALLAKNDELERFYKLTVGRELTMVELKKEVNKLLNQLGEDSKYKIVE